MPATLTRGNLFPSNVESAIFNTARMHSSIAKLSGQTPVPFNGSDIFTFGLDNHAAIVGEANAKPNTGATVGKVKVKPVKIVLQFRTSDEFMTASEEYQLGVLEAFQEAASREVAYALDVMAMHGVDPKTGQPASSTIGDNHLDAKVTNKVVYNETKPDVNIDDAVALVETAEYDVTGLAMAPTLRGAIAALRTNSGGRVYPEFAWGGCPDKLGAMTVDSNKTVSANSNKDRAIVGDFDAAFKWGFAKGLTYDIIEYGDPDGQGTDLKANNEICLRAEAYIGWGILDPNAFARIEASA